jgi:hypothetical protein
MLRPLYSPTLAKTGGISDISTSGYVEMSQVRFFSETVVRNGQCAFGGQPPPPYGVSLGDFLGKRHTSNVRQ